jgi:hypothetical protein
VYRRETGKEQRVRVPHRRSGEPAAMQIRVLSGQLIESTAEQVVDWEP